MRSVAGEQPTEDTDDTANEQEAHGEQEQRLTHDSGADITDESQDLRCDSAEISQQSGHSGSSRSSEHSPFLNYSAAGEQPAEDTDDATDEQEAHGEQEQGLSNDRSADIPDIGQDAGCDSSQRREQISQSDFLLSSEMAEQPYHLTKQPKSQNARKNDGTSVEVEYLCHGIHDAFQHQGEV